MWTITKCQCPTSEIETSCPELGHGSIMTLESVSASSTPPRTVSLGPDAAQSTCPGATHQNFFLAIVQVQGAKRVLNTPTYCSKNRSRHVPRTQTKGLSTFFGDPNTLKSGPFRGCLYPMHPRPNAFVVRTEFKSARVSTRVILGGSHMRPGFSSRIV